MESKQSTFKIEPETLLDDNKWKKYWKSSVQLQKRDLVFCKRCVYHSEIPKIKFNSSGICSFCETHDELNVLFPGGDKGKKQFQEICNQIKIDGKKNKYDIIVGISGGADSSYLISLAKKHDLRVLAVHYDNTWNTPISVENVRNILNSFNVDLHTKVVNNKEMDSLMSAMFKSGVIDFDVSTDLAIFATLYEAAIKYNIKYFFDGHSFRSEGLAPLEWNYIDQRYVDDIYRQYGSSKPIPSIPRLTLSKQLKWMLMYKVKSIRPLWYIDYKKSEAIKDLTLNHGWKWYGGHHLENRTSSFFHSYLLPRRFGIDTRVMGYSALIRSGQMNKKEAFEMLEVPPEFDPNMIKLYLKRLGLNEIEFVDILTGKVNHSSNFKTYKKTFERFRWFFYIMVKMGYMQLSFYMRYTAKD
jgi:N-acetyl sugar amidotransferase